VERLRIELGGKLLDALLVYPIYAGCEPLPYLKVLQI
jgi:hypothetical protein